MLLPLILFALIIYGGSMTKLAWDQHVEVRRLTRNDTDDDVLNYLEACSESSETARAALKIINDPKQLSAAKDDDDDDDDDGKPQKYWDVWQADLDREVDEEFRLKALYQWLIKNPTMTWYAINVILSKFNDEEIRAEVREALMKCSIKKDE